MTCPFCKVELLTICRHGLAAAHWHGCPCCGCMWSGSGERAKQVHPLAWIPACLHSIPAWATT